MSRSNQAVTMQQRLDRESTATMDVVAGDERFEREEPQTHLLFGPYGASPLRGLHFDVADDTVAS